MADWRFAVSRYTKEDIIRMVEEEDVEFIRLQFTDIFGTLKNMAVTSSQLVKVLNNQVVFDGTAVECFTRTQEADMYLYPDLDTFEIFPWRPQNGKVARFICDIYTADGEPYEADCRNVLKKVIREAADMGYIFEVGPECEFFLFHTDDNGYPTTFTHEKAGYFDIGPNDLGENLRRDIVLTLEQMGFEVESSHHESAPAQHEVDFKYDEALITADNLMTFKLAVKTVAKGHGLHATFMPKPIEGVNGSGMHMNYSLRRIADGKNAFEDERDERGLSREAYYFIGGLLAHAKGMMAITNPTVNSYKRLVPGYEAPVYLSWATSNRMPFIRVPITGAKGRRIELCNPDGSSNPYLVIAACLAAGLDGIRRKLEPPKCMDLSIDDMSKEQISEMGIERVTSSLDAALTDFKRDEFMQNVLGRDITEKYIAAKEAECQRYATQVSQWELDEYLARF